MTSIQVIGASEGNRGESNAGKKHRRALTETCSRTSTFRKVGEDTHEPRDVGRRRVVAGRDFSSPRGEASHSATSSTMERPRANPRLRPARARGIPAANPAAHTSSNQRQEGLAMNDVND